MVYFSFETTNQDNVSLIDAISIFSGQFANNVQTSFIEITPKFHITSRKTMAIIIPIPNQSSLQKDITIHEAPDGCVAQNRFDQHAIIVGNMREFAEFTNHFWINPAIKKEILEKYDGRNFGFIVIQIFPNMNGKSHGITYSHKIKHKDVLYLPIKMLQSNTSIKLTVNLLNAIIPENEFKVLQSIPTNLSPLSFPANSEINSFQIPMPSNDSLAFMAHRRQPRPGLRPGPPGATAPGKE
jgi:hypothetical protein